MLFEKNLIVVYDLKHGPSRAGHAKNQGKNFKDGSKQSAKMKKCQLIRDLYKFEKPIFKAKFTDATETISQIFFIKDFAPKAYDEDSDNENS